MSFINRILDELGGGGGSPMSLYALLDAAKEPRVVSMLSGLPDKSQSLYEGEQAHELAAFAPYLVELTDDSPLPESLAQNALGRSYCVYLTSKASFEDVRKHFRHFLMVKTSDDKEVYFRFYDPRVLRVFLPTCTPDEAAQFFGPIKSFWVEARESQVLSRFSLGEDGLLKEDRRLVSEWEAQAAP